MNTVLVRPPYVRFFPFVLGVVRPFLGLTTSSVNWDFSTLDVKHEEAYTVESGVSLRVFKQRVKVFPRAVNVEVSIFFRQRDLED